MSFHAGLIAILTLLMAGCQTTTPRAGEKPPQTRAAATRRSTTDADLAAPLPRHVAGGLAKAMDILRSPSAVESYRIEPNKGEDASRGILGYPIISRGPQLDAATARQLQSLILDPRGYNGDLWCGEIQPGVAFRFVGDGGRQLTVLVCFKCQEWEFWLDGKRLGKDWFVGVQPELLRLVQRVFPADEVLRAIRTGEVYGRVYRIGALNPAARHLSEEERNRLESEWEEKIIDAAGDPGGWREKGGDKYMLRFTEDGWGIIVITTAQGHAAIASIAGVKAMSQDK